MQSLNECRESIRSLAISVSVDITSTLVNTNRITSMRSLLDLFEQYNEMLIYKEEKVKRDFKEYLKV